MNESYFLQWINSEGMKQVPVLVNECKSYEQAAIWAVTSDRPAWATKDHSFIVWHGRPGDAETPNVTYTVASANEIKDTAGIDGYINRQ